MQVLYRLTQLVVGLYSLLSVDDQQEVLHVLFKDPIIEPIKFKMVDIRHLENRQIAI